MKLDHPESREQQALIEWARARAATCEELRLLHSIPNGGFRRQIEAKILIGEGLLAGMPDLFLPVCKDPGDQVEVSEKYYSDINNRPPGRRLFCPKYFGLYIEMKYGKAKLSARQAEIQSALRMQGYKVITCWSWVHAAQAIEEYLNLRRTV